MDKMISLNNKNPLFFSVFTAIVFVFYLYIAYNTPLTHDDWTWGSQYGIQRLDSWFKNYNGRYLGNLLELFLTRVHVIRLIIMAVFSSILVIVTAQRDEQSSKFNYILCFFLYLFIPVTIFSETFAWVAGFSNYIPSIALVLIYLNWMKNIFNPTPPEYKKWQTFVAIPLGLATTLFVEHITLYTVGMAFIVIAITIFKFKKVYALHITYFVSTVIGATIMFSNGAYLQLINGTASYKSIGAIKPHVSPIHKILSSYGKTIYNYLFMDNIVLNIVLGIICIVILFIYKKELTILKRILKYCLVFVLIGYPIYKPIIVGQYGVHFLSSHYREFEAAISLVFYFSLLITFIFYTVDNTFKQKAVFYLISLGVLTLPLSFVHPIGPRCFLATYAIFIVIALEAVNYIKQQELNVAMGISRQIFSTIICFASVSMLIMYFYVFTFNGMVSRERLDYVQKHVAAQDKTILLTTLPYPQFFWHSTPYPGMFQYETFKDFYGVPKGTHLKIITYSKWRKLYKK